MTPVISLTTDFGLDDGYVGTMHGVILNICPDARVIDLCHNIAPQNIKQAAFVLAACHRHFALNAIHVVVVDPGVGSERHALAVQTARGNCYIAPDNGVLTLALASETIRQCVYLTNPRYQLNQISRTFHGRDIFSPAAAHIANGVPLANLGSQAGQLKPLPLAPVTTDANGTIHGHVIYADHFGNLMTDIRDNQLPPTPLDIEIAGTHIYGLSTTYSAVNAGQLVALVGSSGFLEISVRDGSAAKYLNSEPDDEIMVHPANI